MREKTNLVIWATIIAFAGLVFLPMGPVEFLDYDDKIHITKNVFFNPVSLKSFYEIWTTPYAGLYIPVTYTFWGVIALVVQYFQGEGWQSQNIVWPFLILNFTTHIFNSFLVYLLLKEIQPGLKRNSLFFGTLVFLFHPIQVESVAWISAFRDSLCLTFSLVAVLCYFNKKYVWVYILTMMAILCKPMAVTLPVIIIAFDILSSEKLKSLRRTGKLLFYGTLIFVTTPFMILTKHLQPDRITHNIPMVAFRPIVALDAIGFYLKKVFWPFEFGPDYGRTPKWVIANSPTKEIYFSIFFIGGMLCLLKYQKSIKDITVKILLLLFVPLIPVLGLVPFHFQRISTVADRYFYFSMIGVSLASALLYNTLPRIRWILISMVMTFICSSYLHAKYWRTYENFTFHKAEVNPFNDAAQTNVGFLFAKMNNKEAALKRFERALELNPANFSAASNIGTILVEMGNNEQALNHYVKMLDKFPQNAEARIGYGILLSRLNKAEEALDQLNIAIKSDQSNAFAWFNCGVILWNTGRKFESLYYLRRAVVLDPSNENYKKMLSEVEAISVDR